MRVLVTRPEPGCSRTVKLLEQRGHEAVAMPLSRIVDLPSAGEELRAVPVHHAVVTSANAIRAWQALGISHAAVSGPLYAVGERTALTARQAGFVDVRAGAGDGAALAGRILQDMAGGALEVSAAAPLVYVAGRTRHRQFESVLSAKDVLLRIVELYDIAQLSYSTDYMKAVFLERAPVAVLLYSRRAAELLFLAVAPEARGNMLKNCEFFCMSENVVNAIPTQFRNRIAVASHPDEKHLLSLLDRDGGLS